MLECINLLRPIHWVKNLLIFIPMLASHQLNEITIKYSLISFVAFSLIASCGYIINDIVDLDSDKLHPFKKFRPLASGKITKKKGLTIFFVLLILAIFISINININFLIIIISYLFFSTIYSYHFKKIIILDIIVLSSFYSIRIFAGSQATDIFVSAWLLSFSIFFFLSLASLKRQTELVHSIKNKKKKIKGRGYSALDLPLMSMMALCSGYISIVILAFYINSSEVKLLYTNTEYLWGINLVLFYWITKIVVKASRGLMHYDPVIYATKDKESYICMIIMLLFILKGIY